MTADCRYCRTENDNNIRTRAIINRAATRIWRKKTQTTIRIRPFFLDIFGTQLVCSPHVKCLTLLRVSSRFW
jgi:hypothetical protein